MKAGMSGECCHPFVEGRVVLHGAGTERVETGVEVEVPAGQSVVVADDLGLGDLGQSGRLVAEQAGRNQLIEFGAAFVGRELGRSPARHRLLVDGPCTVGLLGRFGLRSRTAHDAFLRPAVAGTTRGRTSGSAVRWAATEARSDSASHSMSAGVRFSVRATRKPSSYSG